MSLFAAPKAAKPAKTYTEPQAYATDARPPIPMEPVESNQVKAIGFDDATGTLAVTFTRGPGAIYHYGGVARETFEAFKGAESIGTFFGKNIKQLPFKKYPAEAISA